MPEDKKPEEPAFDFDEIIRQNEARKRKQEAERQAKNDRARKAPGQRW